MSGLTLGFWGVHAVGALAGGWVAWSAGQRVHRRLGLSHAAYGYWMGVWLLAVTRSCCRWVWRCGPPHRSSRCHRH